MAKDDLEITFRKRGVVRFLSHLDVMRIFEQAVRRTGLPARYTEGFNPHLKLSSPRALGLGVESECEVMIIALNAPVGVERVAKELDEQLPQGIDVLSVTPPRNWKGEVAESYELRFCDPDYLVPRTVIDGLLAEEELRVLRVRKGRELELNLRPMIRRMEATPGCLRVDLASIERRQPKATEIHELIAARTEGLPETAGLLKLRLDPVDPPPSTIPDAAPPGEPLAEPR